MCYVCRKEIPKSVAYAHFCQTPHCNHKSCGKCALYADVRKEDEKRVKDAAKKAAKKQKTNVDVASLLKNPSPARPPARARRGRGGGGYVPPGHHEQQMHRRIQRMNHQIMLAQQMLEQARRNRGRRR